MGEDRPYTPLRESAKPQVPGMGSYVHTGLFEILEQKLERWSVGVFSGL